MTPNESSRLIDAAGGDAKLAEIIGIAEKEGARQRVNNWRRRGIPAAVILEHRDLFDRLRQQSQDAA